MTLGPQTYRKVDNIHRVGLASAKPAAGDVLVGTLYYSTDTSRLERSNGTTWEFYSVEPITGGASHHATHETGGSDAIVSISGGVITSGTVADARLTANVLKFTGGYPGGTVNFLRADGTFSAIPSVAPSVHAPTHKVGGSDPLDVKQLAGYPSNSTVFLNGSGAFTIPSSVPSAHATTHGYGGSDLIYSLPAEVTVTGNASVLSLHDVNSPAGSRRWRFVNYNTGILQIEAIADAGSPVQATPLTLKRTGDVSVNGRLGVTSCIASGIDTAGLSAGNNPSLYLYDASQPANSRMWRIMNQSQLLIFYSQDDGESGHVARMRISRLGDVDIGRNINVTSGVFAASAQISGGLVVSGNTQTNTLASTGQIQAHGGILSDPASGEALYASCYPHARIHLRATSLPAGAQTFVILGYNQGLFLAATSDDGASPIGGDWGYSFYLNRSGNVVIGTGGLSVTKVNSYGQLAHGTWTPVDAGAISNLTANNYYAAQYLRVGNTVTVSGQIDVNSPTIGVECQARMFLPLYTLGGLVSSGATGRGVNTSTAGESGGCIVQVSAGHVDIMWVAKVTGLHGLFYHFTYTTT